jgi:hypothetical protein
MAALEVSQVISLFVFQLVYVQHSANKEQDQELQSLRLKLQAREHKQFNL